MAVKKFFTDLDVDGSLTLSVIADQTSTISGVLVPDSGLVKTRSLADLASDLGISDISTMFSLGDDDHINALYPLNISSLYVEPDTGVLTMANMGVTSDSDYGAEMSFKGLVGGSNVFKFGAFADGAGGTYGYFAELPDLTVDGDITADNLSGTNTDDVTLAGSYDYITLVNQVITRNQIDLTTDVTGLLPDGNIASAATWNALVTMTYPGAGIALSTGSAWDTSITDNSTNWNTAYTHSQLTSGNPHSVTKSDVGLSNVENTALSTWAGSANITTLGTITTGIWSGTALVAGKVPNHDDLNGYVANEHIDWTTDQGATNIHSGNYTDTTYVSSDFDHDALTNYVANQHIDWTSTSEDFETTGTVTADQFIGSPKLNNDEYLLSLDRLGEDKGVIKLGDDGLIHFGEIVAMTSLFTLPDSGLVTIASQNVTSDSDYGDDIGFALSINGNLLKYYGQADGAGGILNLTLDIPGDVSANNISGTNTGDQTISAGSGMDFSDITGDGAVTMGTPTTVTRSTSNTLSATSHTHALSQVAFVNFANIWTANQTLNDNVKLYFGTSGLGMEMSYTGTRTEFKLIQDLMFKDASDNNVINFNNAIGSGIQSFVDIVVPDEVYGSGWNGSTQVPTKNAVYDKIETLSGNYVATDSDTNVSANTEWQDSYYAQFGNDADMKIGHISGTNYLELLSSLNIKAVGGTVVARINQAGTYPGFQLLDSKYMAFGTDNDCRIYHDGTNMNIDNVTGIIDVIGSDIRIGDADKFYFGTTYNNYINGDSTPVMDFYLNGALKMAIQTVGVVSLGYFDGDSLRSASYLRLLEITTPTATTNYGKVYTKSDNKLYFQDGAGVEHEIATV